ncbi:Ctr-domain-containing protein [Xylariaceae sp. FL0594]|nr:Ctr-domain-containing protein [Xylariaceae sp. FL0594]
MDMSTTDIGSAVNTTGDGGVDMATGMEMDSGGCKLSMLWNWNTIDTCFVARSWHIRTEGMMAGSCIGIFLLVVLWEFVRRAGREYDAMIIRQFQARVQNNGIESSDTTSDGTAIFRASPFQQLVRSIINAAAFAIAYILMLIAMSYNGYAIIMIILGAACGKFLADWAPKKVSVRLDSGAPVQVKDLNKCGEDVTMCCG